MKKETEYESYSTKDAVIIKRSPAGNYDIATNKFRDSFKQNIQILHKIIEDMRI